MVVVASVCQPSTLRMLIWPEASRAQNSMAAVSAEGSTVWVLMRRLNSSCSRSMAFVVRADFHWPGGQPGEGEQRLAGLLEAVGDGPALRPPLAQERLPPRLDLPRGRGVDHVRV